MSDRRLAAYHRLPTPMRSAVATVQGARLRWWRYGRYGDRATDEALARDDWTAERWQAWQAERLELVLARAAATVPWYHARWRERGDGAPGELARWPVLAKEQVRQAPSAFVSEAAPTRLYADRTSGTSGTPVITYASRRTLQGWFALHEARVRRWNGVSRHDRWALLGGQAVVDGDRDRPPFWVHNHSGHQLYLSGQHVSATNVAAYAQALAAHRPTHLVTYPSLGASLAGDLIVAGIELDVPLVVTNAEGVTPGQRERFEQAFGATTRETYGMAEMVGGASACQLDRLHWWPDAGVVEVLDDDDQPVAPGQVGRLVLTGLANPDQVLVRYDVGDRSRGLDPDPCPCGRAAPVLLPVEGRVQDVLVLPDGRRVFWLNPLFYDLPVVAAQVVQTAVDQIVVRVVPAAGWDDAAEDRVLDRARTRVGRGVHVEVQQVDHLEPGPSGKVRPVVSSVR